ncbi:MAG: Crp/Fnr family transcriptional regulator [Bradymonadaceae bacterium]|nr:Crp/Fnr family transcriptional regulator [Lujinxingiaceae bacterium]
MLSPDMWFFRQLGVDSRLPQDVLSALKREGRVERWGHGATIHHEPGELDLYVILGGEVLLNDGSSGRQTRLVRGDIFGESATARTVQAERAQRSAASLIAFDETTLCAVSHDVFREHAREHLGNFETSLGTLGKRKRVLVPVLPLICTTPASRLARVLLHLAETEGLIDNDCAKLPTAVKPAQLGRLTGLDKGRVSLLLAHFLAEGLLVENSSGALLPSLEKLRTLAVHHP